MQTKEAKAARKARALYARCHQGVLSTLSLELPGHPFGSVAPFAPDTRGRPLLLMSRIAEHTRNADADARVSLLVAESGDDSQEAGRLTLVGSARRLGKPEQAAGAERYFRRFPHAREYSRAHDFDFYVLEPLRLRYIGGFGQIHWLEPAEVCRPNPFGETVESGMAKHMNDDHAPALNDYCRLFGIEPRGQAPRLSAIDDEGFDLMVGKRLLRIDFEQPVASADQVRKAMVALVLRAKEMGVAA